MTDDFRDHERHPEDAQRSIRQEIKQMFGEEEPRLDPLFAADAALPALPVEPKPKSGFIYIAPLLLVIGIVGLALRIVLVPIRGALRRRAERREVARLDAERLYLREAYDKLETNPKDDGVRINLAIVLARYDRALAERLLDQVVSTTAESSPNFVIALHNRGLVRSGLHLERLGRADRERARRLGFVQKRSRRVPAILRFTFELSAGLHFD